MTNRKMVEKLRKGKPVFGSFVKVDEPRLIESFGHAGFDYVIFDAEHGTYNFSQLENMVRTADGVGMSSVIRVPDCTEHSILHGLDVGAGGVQVPSLRDIEVAKYGAQFSKYYPLGVRGMCGDQRASDYGFQDMKSYFQYANENSLLIYQVETKEMVDQIEELCKIDLVDVLFIGPGDLSQAYGCPGQSDAPIVQEAIRHVCRVGLEHNKIVGTFAMDDAGMRRYLDMGMLYMSYGTDMLLFNRCLRDIAAGFEQYR